MEYILAPKTKDVCIFCGVREASPAERSDRFVLVSTESAFVMLNRYPFAAGHLLIVPHRHASRLEDLDMDVYDALFRLVRESTRRLREAVRAEGLNVGINLGEPAGAGIAEHVHVHIIPRWSGDTNFVPVLTGTRVIPQALDETRDFLTPHFADLGTDVSTHGGIQTT